MQGPQGRTWNLCNRMHLVCSDGGPQGHVCEWVFFDLGLHLLASAALVFRVTHSTVFLCYYLQKVEVNRRQGSEADGRVLSEVSMGRCEQLTPHRARAKQKARPGSGGTACASPSQCLHCLPTWRLAENT